MLFECCWGEIEGVVGWVVRCNWFFDYYGVVGYYFVRMDLGVEVGVG